jgi:hypothetical protein
MKHALILLFVALISAQANAQQPAPGLCTMVVKGLDSATRDALSRDLQNASGTRLVYACVPAGILVFSTPQGDAATARAHVEPLLRRHVRHEDISDMGISLEQAEARCAQTRDR